MKSIWLLCCNTNQGHEEGKFSSHLHYLHYCKARVTQLKSIALNFLKQDKTYKGTQGCFKHAQFKKKESYQVLFTWPERIQATPSLSCYYIVFGGNLAQLYAVFQMPIFNFFP